MPRSPEGLASSTVSVDGAAVHYWKAGTGPALVMVHGLVANGLSWEPNIAALATVRTVYALDLPNMGRTARVPRMPAGLAAMAGWLGRFLDAAGIPCADFVASSHGGAVSLMLAAAHPERVRSLALFAPANPFCVRPRPLIAFYNSWLGGLFAQSIPWMPRFAHEMAHRRVYGDPRKASSAAIEGYSLGLNRASIEHSLRIVKSWWEDMAELQRALPAAARVRTLLLWGDRDGVVGLDSGYKLQSVLGAELAVIRGAGHLPFAEEPAESNRLLLDWLTRGGGDREAPGR